MLLGLIDYGVLIALLSLSIAVGIYQGCFRPQQQTNNEFLIANGEMKILPTAMSLLASLMSAATLLGIPLEIYSYGTMYLYWIFAYFIGTLVTVRLFIPIFRRLGHISIYSYLEQRFSLAVRIVITIDFIFVNILYLAVVLYGPSLALSQVTGLDIWLAVLSSGIVCTFYTSIGGMRAVIWTDVIQTVLMFSGVILSIIFGILDAGGISHVFQRVIDGKRIQLTIITLNPSIRYTVWSVLIGGSLNAIGVYACLQTQAQRYLCVKSTRAAQKVAWTNFIMCSMMLFLCTIVGCLLYAKYGHCDPFLSKKITKPDQIYPLFVIETLGRLPGLTGLFIASVLSASLSTISSGVNSIAAVLFEDIYRRLSLRTNISQNQQTTISKLLSVFIGLLVVFLAFMTSYLGDNIIVLVFQIYGSFVAPILGVFLLGFFAPRVTSRCVLIAMIVCFFFQSWILIGANMNLKKYSGLTGRLPTSVDKCSNSFNLSQTSEISSTNENPFLPLYSISMLWYSFNAVVITVVVGLLSSLVWKKNSKPIEKSLIISWKTIFRNDVKNQNETNEMQTRECENMI